MDVRQAAETVRGLFADVFADESKDARFEEARFNPCVNVWRLTVGVRGAWAHDGWVADAHPITGRSYTLVRIDDETAQVLSVSDRRTDARDEVPDDKPAMNVNQAAGLLREHFTELFSDKSKDARIDEVKFKHRVGEWRFTISVPGPWDENASAAAVERVTGRSYKLVCIDDAGGRILSVTDRVFAIESGMP